MESICPLGSPASWRRLTGHLDSRSTSSSARGGALVVMESPIVLVSDSLGTSTAAAQSVQSASRYVYYIHSVPTLNQ